MFWHLLLVGFFWYNLEFQKEKNLSTGEGRIEMSGKYCKWQHIYVYIYMKTIMIAVHLVTLNVYELCCHWSLSEGEN